MLKNVVTCFRSHKNNSAFRISTRCIVFRITCGASRQQMGFRCFYPSTATVSGCATMTTLWALSTSIGLSTTVASFRRLPRPTVPSSQQSSLLCPRSSPSGLAHRRCRLRQWLFVVSSLLSAGRGGQVGCTIGMGCVRPVGSPSVFFVRTAHVGAVRVRYTVSLQILVFNSGFTKYKVGNAHIFIIKTNLHKQQN